MKTLKFKNLTILSDLQKTANQFQFHNRFNLIVSNNKNSVGKTSVVKNLFWCLGCEPRFDSKWKNLNAKALLNFSIDDKDYWIARQGNRMFLSHNGSTFETFPKIPGAFAEQFAKLVNFNAKLPIRNTNTIETPPPAFYFLPFYIDQKISWGSAWDSFEKLSQYARWQDEIVPYHIGITNKNYFDIAEKIFERKREQSAINKEITRIDTAISVVSEFLPPVETTVDLKEFDEIREELKKDLLELHNQQEVLFEELAMLRAEKSHTSNQLEIASEAIEKLIADYEYASELDEEIECPTCGTLHDNSIINRFSLLEDKDQAEQIAKRLNKTLIKLNKNLKEKESDLSDIRVKIDKLNDKYNREEKDTVFTLQNILDSTASHSVKNKVEGHRSQKITDLTDSEKSEIKLNKQKKDETKESRKRVNVHFKDLFPSYTNKLHAFGVNSESIKSPQQYSKVANSGGAAEGSRAMFAYYLAVYNLISSHSEQALSPFVIDTPNQQDQAIQHYEKIVKLIKENTPQNAQIFLCGMDSTSLAPLKEQGSTIMLNKEHSLLTTANYEQCRERIGWIFELVSEDDKPQEGTDAN